VFVRHPLRNRQRGSALPGAVLLELLRSFAMSARTNTWQLVVGSAMLA